MTKKIALGKYQAVKEEKAAENAAAAAANSTLKNKSQQIPSIVSARAKELQVLAQKYNATNVSETNRKVGTGGVKGSMASKTMGFKIDQNRRIAKETSPCDEVNMTPEAIVQAPPLNIEV